MLEVHVPVRVWRFKSSRPHQRISAKTKAWILRISFVFLSMTLASQRRPFRITRIFVQRSYIWQPANLGDEVSDQSREIALPPPVRPTLRPVIANQAQG